MIQSAAVFEEQSRALKSITRISSERVQRFLETIRSLDDWDLYRINPIAFSHSHGFEEKDAVDLFVESAKAGIFDFTWSKICPFCGGMEHSFDSMNEMQQISHCTVCNVDIPEELDSQVEVSFTINPDIKKLELSEFDSFDNYRKTFFSRNFIPSDALSDYSKRNFRGFISFLPGEEKEIALEGKDGELFRLINVALHSAALIHFRSDAEEHERIQILDGGFAPEEISVRPGSSVIRVINKRNSPISVSILKTEFEELHGILKEHTSGFHPFLTGKMLLNTQTFRDHFRIQSLIPDLKLKISSLTILFTDLKGSTELYDKTGDVFAYSLIQEHFRILSDSVRKHSGAIIKTMGDAIMATFSLASSGMSAAMEMMEKMEEFNKKQELNGYDLGLKIGLHEGSALVVNADERLDYFGQTVNIAARVQNLAGSGEIVMTSPVYEYPGVQRLMASGGYRKARRQSVSLKGVGSPTLTYRCSKKL